MKKKTSSKKDLGRFLILNGKKLELTEHSTDFSVLENPSQIKEAADKHHLTSRALSSNVTRLTSSDARQRDRSMADIRKKSVAHHIYTVKGTGEEIVIDDRIFLRLRRPDPDDLRMILEQFHLIEEGRMGETYVLKVTSATGQNPIKTANAIAQRQEVLSCSPQVLVPRKTHQTAFVNTHPLFREQWYLTADLIMHSDVDPRAGIQCPEAWQITMGNPEIVVGVMDDGFDLDHPAFRNKRVHPAAKDFADTPVDSDPRPGSRDFHGTPVASIATGSIEGGAMVGIAPHCTFLPIRIGFGLLDRVQTLIEFRHASQHADVLNCSFGFPPLSFDIFDPGFRQEIREMTQTGGRRGKGLVIVFSAGNDDAATRLRGTDNVNGVRFLDVDQFNNFVVRSIPAGNDVFSAYPSIEGVVVVGALSSRLRKSGYSNWGEHITVTAPSSNGHELGSLPDFSANFRGLGQIGAVNRPGHGDRKSPLQDNPTTPIIREDFYTDDFGGTSGAAPVVSGVVGLMLSVNPDLAANDVRQILMATADRDLDPNLDLPNDPNVQGISGAMVNGRSAFFGSGKVNALRAVQRAQALGGGTGGEGERHGSIRPNLPIPDNKPEGIVSHITITGHGAVEHIIVDVDITHTYQGDLNVTLVSPEGFTAELHRVFQGGGTDDLLRTYRASDTQSLRRLAEGGVEGGGRWTLHVSDNLHRDTGTLNAWSVDLRSLP